MAANRLTRPYCNPQVVMGDYGLGAQVSCIQATAVQTRFYQMYSSMLRFVLQLVPASRESIVVISFGLLSFVAALIVGYAVYIDASRRNNPNAVLIGLFVGFFTVLGIIPGFIALLLYLYGRGID